MRDDVIHYEVPLLLAHSWRVKARFVQCRFDVIICNKLKGILLTKQLLELN